MARKLTRKTPTPTSAGRKPVEIERPPPEMSPSRYVEKVDLMTRVVMDDEILPKHLLVRTHRDYHVADIQAQRFMSRLMKATGSEKTVLRKMKEIRDLGHRASELVAKLIGNQDPSKVAKFLFGINEKEYYYRFKKPDYSRPEIAATVERLRREAAEKMAAMSEAGRPAIRVLLTGGTGFVGKEFLWQAAQREEIAEVVVLARPKKIVDRQRRQRYVLSPAERGERLLGQLGLDETARRKYRFIAGDIEETDLGISEEDFADLASTVTHVVHSAASVAFDDPYEASFLANVKGTLRALELSRRLQNAPGSPFVAHVGIETSYIHGRKMRQLAREDEIVFPRNFYNNYYELTKAMASLETERYMLEHGLRVVQLCPAIVIGDSRTGNNRGDTKVVNAPVNVFGRAHQALTRPQGNWVERSKAAILAKMACVFPGDPSAQINLIPVDWVVKGILAALLRPRAIGERVHLAAEDRVTSDDMTRILREEVGVEVTLAEPVVHRTITQPILSRLLHRFDQQRLAYALEKLGTIFGGYSEWGQTHHQVGKDVTVLGLPTERPNAHNTFRMLCRHNRYVQNFGQIRDEDEISRRERLWHDFVLELERESGGPVGALPAVEFHRAVAQRLDLDSPEPREGPPLRS